MLVTNHLNTPIRLEAHLRLKYMSEVDIVPQIMMIMSAKVDKSAYCLVVLFAITNNPIKVSMAIQIGRTNVRTAVSDIF